MEWVGRLTKEEIGRIVCFHCGVVNAATGMIARVWRELAEER